MIRYVFILVVVTNLISACRTKSEQRKTSVQYLIENHSSDKVWVYFRHSFPPEPYKENMLVVDTGQKGVCTQFADVYTTRYLTQFVCGQYAEELIIFKVNSHDTMNTQVIANHLWNSQSYDTDDYQVTACTYILTDADF